MQSSKARRRSAAATASMLALTAGLAIADQAAARQAAQPTGQGANETTVVDEIVVGTRASLQSAMNRKKRAGTISDSIVAEDISQFPDKNVGEALGRITGVQLARDFGEGNAVSIRGVGCRSQKVSHRREARGSAQRGRLFFEHARLAGTGLTQQNIRSLLTQRVDGQPGWLRRVGLQHDVAGNIGES